MKKKPFASIYAPNKATRVANEIAGMSNAAAPRISEMIPMNKYIPQRLVSNLAIK
jgi:hypothetical protein